MEAALDEFVARKRQILIDQGQGPKWAQLSA